MIRLLIYSAMIFLYTISAHAVFLSSHEMYLSLSDSGFDTVISFSPTTTNKLKIHRLDPNGNHERLSAPNLREIVELEESDNEEFPRIHSLSYYRKNRRTPDVAIKISESIICYAKSTNPIETPLLPAYNAISHQSRRRLSTKEFNVNEINILNQYDKKWGECIVFPLEIDDVLVSLALDKVDLKF